MISKQSVKTKGMLSIGAATVLYGLVGVYTRMIGHNFEAFTQIWVRSILILAIVFPPIIISKQWKKIEKIDLPWIVFWITSGIVAASSFFLAANNLSLGTTIIVFYAGSNVSGYLSGFFFFKEKINFTKIVALVLSFLGIGIIYASSLDLTNIGFLGFAFTSGFATGIWNTISKKFSHHYSQLQLVALDAILACLFSLIIATTLHEQIPSISFNISWLGIILYSVTQIIFVALTIYGFKHLEAQIGTLIMPLEVFWAALFGFLFFNEMLGVTTVIGGVLIILGLILPIFEKEPPDQGESRFYVSLEDDLMRIFGGEQVKKIMEMMNIPDDMPIEHNMVSRALEKSQTRVEGHNFDIRKHLVDYDDVMNKQREIIYKRRRRILEEGTGENEEVSLRDRILAMIDSEIREIVLSNLHEGSFDYPEIIKDFSSIIPFNSSSKKEIEGEISQMKDETEIIEKLQDIAVQTYDKREEELGKQTVRGIEKFITLSTIDNLWQLHLTDIDHLRNGIGLRGYGQRDPLVEYKAEAFKLFEQLIGKIDNEIVNRIYRVSVAQKKVPATKIKEIKPEVESIAQETGSKAISPAVQADRARKKTSPVKAAQKVGRNDPCPCGSGKKYKKCFLLEGSGCKLQG